ncbi:endonuclease Htp3-like [Actinia tenebrosa]|uniref:Endonuclease Htp3-like n=1 Tax=Actinia tenebrosa TaxID=6105 RepID=A0A6P8HQX2_ACTTE|nr:endonuclease Htp3-like [Actinia tenebrosa]XP_031558930.1 endonuclease Htp3-like [Actinia tenebrosa]
MVWITEYLSSLFGSENEEKEKENFVTKASNFVDNYLPAFRAGTLLLAGTGILIIVKRAYLFSWFRRANDIPKEFITKGITLRGQVKGISSNNTLQVLHIPLITTSTFRKYKESNHESPSNLLSLALAGVEFRDGSKQWLTDNLVDSHIKFLPLQVDLNSQISSIVHKKRGYFRRNICVNEELVKQGLAVTGNYDKHLEQNEKFKNLFSRLFKAEAYALKKHKGIWYQPATLERIKNIKLPLLSSFIMQRKKQSNGGNTPERRREVGVINNNVKSKVLY